MINIFFIHGFGVRKDARGMFTEIENYLSKKHHDLSFFYTDLNDYSEDEKNTYLQALSEQKTRIQKTIQDNIKLENKNYIIAHSQGCVVACLLGAKNISQVIFLAPPSNNDINRTINNFKKRPGTEINREGQSTLMRSNGSKTFVPAIYWKERERYSYEELYKTLNSDANLDVIFAGQDELIDNDAFGKISGIDMFTVNGNHNFEGVNRKELLSLLSKNYFS